MIEPEWYARACTEFDARNDALVHACLTASMRNGESELEALRFLLGHALQLKNEHRDRLIKLLNCSPMVVL